MGLLYGIEREARGLGLTSEARAALRQEKTSEARAALRQEKARPVLDDLFVILEGTRAPPGHALDKAVQYTLKHWPYLIKYVDYGAVEIDNNGVENKIRPFALGRKNWLFLGHAESAKLSALLYSLIESSKLNDLVPYDYIHYLLSQVHALRRGEVDAASLLPHHIDRQLVASFAKAHQARAEKAWINVAQTNDDE